MVSLISPHFQWVKSHRIRCQSQLNIYQTAYLVKTFSILSKTVNNHVTVTWTHDLPCFKVNMSDFLALMPTCILRFERGCCNLWANPSRGSLGSDADLAWCSSPKLPSRAWVPESFLDTFSASHKTLRTCSWSYLVSRTFCMDFFPLHPWDASRLES